MMKRADIRFYEELNDFLPASKRKTRYGITFTGTPSVKDVIEAQGVPHTEIDMILINGISAGFKRKLKGGEDISVYPVFESFDVSKVQRLRGKPLRRPKFVLDVHLGTHSRYLRMLGFDALYSNNFTDPEIVNISVEEKRCILTRDLGILKHSAVVRGYWIRNSNPLKQVEETVKRFQLQKEIKEFSRCVHCNSKLKRISKKKIEAELLPKVKMLQNDFTCCTNCGRIYWKGTHYNKMLNLIEHLRKE